MLTLEECKKILNIGEYKYSDKQIIAIKDFLALMAEIHLITTNS